MDFFTCSSNLHVTAGHEGKYHIRLLFAIRFSYGCVKLNNMVPADGGSGREGEDVHTPTKDEPELKKISLKRFFETIAPGGTMVEVDDQLQMLIRAGSRTYRLPPVDIDLYCDMPTKCGGVRSFEKITEEYIAPGCSHSLHVRFRCRNCRVNVKLYSLLVSFVSEVCTVMKLAEVPDFGPPTPARVFNLVGGERDYYLKGRRSENHGLGIAAFAYYRRVVENQKNRIIEEIIKASRKIGAPHEMISDLEAAKNESRFKESLETVRHGVPQALLVNGHNPLTLLHAALSEGLHGRTDDECLELATTVRVVLTDLAERIGVVLKDQAELDTAVSKLMASKAKKNIISGMGGNARSSVESSGPQITHFTMPFSA